LKISLITVSFNSAKTIHRTLDSVVAQRYHELEYIIIDGKSKDDTLDIIKSYSDIISFCVSEPDKGIYDAMNKGVSLATGDVIGILNSDDFYLEDNVLAEVSSIFEKNPSVDAILGDVDFVKSSNLSSPFRSYKVGKFMPWMLYFGLMPPHPAVFVRKAVYERIGLYKLGYKIGADFDFLVRLILVNKAKYYISNKTWVRMRAGGVSTSGFKSNIISTQEMARSLRENSLFSSYVFLISRLPLKFFMQIFPRLFSLK